MHQSLVLGLFGVGKNFYDLRKKIGCHWRAADFLVSNWLRGTDLNCRPLGYEPNELPDCSTPRIYFTRVSIEGKGGVKL